MFKPRRLVIKNITKQHIITKKSKKFTSQTKKINFSHKKIDQD